MKLFSYLKAFVLITSIVLSFSAQAFVLSGFKWDSTTPGVGASLSWGYASDGTDCRVSSDPCGGGTVSDISTTILPEGAAVIDSEVHRAFDAWSSVADLTFTFTTDSSPDILIGGHGFDGPGSILAHSFTSFSINSGGMNQATVNDIHFDTGDTFRLAADIFSPGGYFFNVLAHEIGHTLGLGHVDDFSSLMNPIVPEFFDGPQTDDIAGVQFLYGATAVPLPATVWLMISGFGVLAAIRRKVFVS